MSGDELNSTLDAFLKNEVNMPQAYLFLGSSDEQSNARKIVQDFASKVSGQVIPNPDVLIYDVNENGNIDSLRDTMQLASLMPVKSGRKVALMLNMHKSNVQMQNALLKILEEPPKHTVFLLISSLPLLPTIMSRCQVFNVHQSSEELLNFDELAESIQLLEKHRTSGIAEKMVLVNQLAEMDDDELPKLVEHWMYRQVQELKQSPGNYKAVRASMETLESLRGNFNKKMVLQKFITTAL